MRVLVVGAGVAGLVAAGELTAAGCDVSVVERGARPGGRLVTVEVGDAVADVGAQFFTVRTPAFDRRVDDWVARGLVDVWCTGFGVDDGHPRYVARRGMASLVDDLTDGLDVRCATMAFAVRRTDGAVHPGRWVVVTDDGEPHRADAVVLTTPLPQAFALLADTDLLLDDDFVRTDYDRTVAWVARLDRPPRVPSPGALQAPVEGVAIVVDNGAKGLAGGPSITVHADTTWSERHWDDEPAALRTALTALAGPWLDGAQVAAFSPLRCYENKTGSNRLRGSLHSLTARHVDEASSRVGRLARKQPKDRARDLLHLPAAPHRHILLDALDTIGLAAARVHLGVDEPGTNGIHADTFCGDLLSQTNGQRIHGPLGGRVVDVFVRRAETRSRRGHVHDSSAGATVLRRHPAHRLAGTNERPDHVGREDALNSRGIHFLYAHLPLEYAGVVHESRRTAEHTIASREQLHDFSFAGNVCTDRDGAPAGGFDSLQHVLGGVLVRTIVDAHRVAALRGELGRGGAYASAGSGDDDDLIPV